MQIVQLSEFGDAGVLTVREVPVPRPGPGQVLVRVTAAAVNFADVIRRRGGTYPFPTPLPFTPGSEVAGTVAELGAGVDGPPVGTEVFALTGEDGSGGYAQYALASAPQVVPVPPGVSSAEAAGIVVAGSTAQLMLTEVGRVTAGETVLVQGAGGGVGGYAVQLAKLAGATVVAAASTTARREAALAGGADHVVDYTRAGWSAEVRELTGGRGVDLVLEMAGGDVFAESLALLAPFGRVVVAGMAGRRPLVLAEPAVRSFFYDPALNQSLHAFNLGAYVGLRPEAAVRALRTLVGHVAAGRVKVPLGPTLPLHRAADAHRLLEDRATTGKIILDPWPNP